MTTQAQVWWGSLSINEMKAMEKKHKTIFGMATSREVEEMYAKEHPQGPQPTVYRPVPECGTEDAWRQSAGCYRPDRGEDKWNDNGL